MSKYRPIIDQFNLEKKYKDINECNTIRKNLKSDLSLLFNKYYPLSKEYERDHVPPSTTTKNLKKILKQSTEIENIATDLPLGIQIKVAELTEEYKNNLEKIKNDHSKKTSKTRYRMGTIPVEFLAIQLATLWGKYAYRPGKGVFSSGDSRFNNYISSAFDSVNEKLPDRKTLNKYLKQRGN